MAKQVSSSRVSVSSFLKLKAAFACLLGLIFILASCASDHPLDTFEADAGPNAERINNLFYPVLIVAIIVLILVDGAIIYMIRRFKARKREEALNSVADPYDPDNPSELHDEPLPKQTHGNLRLEIAWTIIPTIILGVISAFTLIAIFDLEEVTAAEDDLRVTVVGQQWWWEFQYHLDGNTDSPPDFVSPGELVIPVGQQVPLKITSRDVIHSYWIPQLNGKKDATPGRYHDWTLEASRPGRYLGQCTEFCGLSHGWMRMYTVALAPDDWDEWARNQLRPAALLSPSDENYEGQQLFVDNCARCHSIAGVTDTNADGLTDDFFGENNPYDGSAPVHDQLVSGAAPDLTHLMSRSTFAGASYDLYEDRAEDVPYNQIANAGELNAVDLERWIANAPSRKPAMWEDARGMPPFPNLTTEDLDTLITYLTTLK